MKRIIATFRLDIHANEFHHFMALFGGRYIYHYSRFNGMRIVDVMELY